MQKVKEMRLTSNIQVVVAAIHQETPLVKKFTLTPLDGEPLDPFSGGSHITTYLPSLSQDQPLERHYSLISSPTERSYYQIAVRLHDHSSGGSAYWHQQARVGTQLVISQPKNHFPLSSRAKHHVFYAAGIGITPILAMMTDLQAKGESFELHYAARSREDCPFYQEICARFGNQSHFYFSREQMRMTPDSMSSYPIGTHLYFCGPAPMVHQFREAALACGYPLGSIHYELFTPPVCCEPQPFQAILQSAGTVIEVARDQSLLDALLKAGIRVPYSCRVGACGTCEMEVLAGEVEHRDSVLSEEERKKHERMMTCVSRARTPQIILRV